MQGNIAQHWSELGRGFPHIMGQPYNADTMVVATKHKYNFFLPLKRIVGK